MSRFLIFTPRKKDSDLIAGILERAELEAHLCRSIDELLQWAGADATGVITTEEMLRPDLVDRLRRVIERQPLWSDLSIIVFTGADTNGSRVKQLEKLGPRASVTLLDRPISMDTLASIARATHRARLRQYEVRDLFAKLEERIHERDRFLAILGHELRNPLGAIVLAAQMGEDGTIDSQHAERIERQTMHLSRLVDDLLDHARITTGKITLKHGPHDLNQLVEQCLRTIPRDQKRRIDVSFEPCPEPLPLHVDGMRIDQVISNLLTNALKYTRDGGRIVLRTSREEGMARLSVEDTGVGIAPDRIGKIFDLFSQAENAIGRSQGGMGIGLNLVRTLVELHDGTVSASSAGLDQGSTFTVSLPLAADRATDGPPVAERPGSAPSVAPREGKRIVVVDDNSDIRDLLEIRLRKLGHEVSTAADGQSGLQRIVSERPDVAIVDIGLPGLDGYELARRVRDAMDHPVVLVALTGFGQDEDREHALAAGFDEHLVKPIRVEDLQRVLIDGRDRKRPAAAE